MQVGFGHVSVTLSDAGNVATSEGGSGVYSGDEEDEVAHQVVDRRPRATPIAKTAKSATPTKDCALEASGAPG